MFALCELNNCITHLVDAESALELFRLMRIEVNCMFALCELNNCITHLVDAEYPEELKPCYLLASLLRTKGKLD